MDEILENRLKELRRAHGLTQQELALEVQVSRKTINTIENRVFFPSTVLALKLAARLGCRVEDIFYLVPQETEKK